MEITSYQDFIAMAKQQPEPQRLLFVLAKAQLPEQPTDVQKQQYEQQAGGNLEPVLCVDKLPEEVESFDVLVDESKHTKVDWDIAFVTAMDGRGGHPVSSDEASQPLEMMVQQIQAGMIKHFLTLNRQGELVQVM
ncbi:ribonucleotide reductase subunit alpha [Idiomarina seosinensis]|uniref:Ribonucleotide reductase subunit alpha n=1 Tax=Idiomarina seosinensis TaxID=281739 RepID=A0A432ZFH2_9GAMM|nr:ribonucleotide reductase subunit alpha [Idiomarina seosinensis]RUO76092.1 ribonucleotide reductase subunit alpha [Idiomarina seosinensis]